MEAGEPGADGLVAAPTQADNASAITTGTMNARRPTKRRLKVRPPRSMAMTLDRAASRVKCRFDRVLPALLRARFVTERVRARPVRG